MGWGWPWARELGADTHRFSLGALFTFEASNARLALGKERADSRTGLSPQTLPPPPQTPLKAPPRKGHWCESRKEGWRGLTPGVLVGLGVHSGPYRLTFRAQRPSCTLRARWTTGPREAGGTSNARSTLSA